MTITKDNHECKHGNPKACCATCQYQAKQKPTERELDDFVGREVLTCQSSLVEEMLGVEEMPVTWDDVVNGYKYLCPECCGDVTEENSQSDGKCPHCGETWKGFSIDSTPQEIMEWWVVSDWLTDKLEAHGEPILKTDYGTWWGRTCSGQAINMDRVIEDIYKEIMK